MCFISVISRTPVVFTAAATTLMALMLGSCPRVGRFPGEMAEAAPDIGLSVHGEGPDGGTLEWRSRGVRVRRADWRGLALSSQPLPRAIVPTMARLVDSGFERSVIGARIVLRAVATLLWAASLDLSNNRHISFGSRKWGRKPRHPGTC